MRTILLAATALTALVLLAPVAPAQQSSEKTFIIYLHEPLHIAPPQVNVNVGDTVTFDVKNFNPNPHDLVVCGNADCSERWGYTGVSPNGEALLTFEPTRAGTFEYYCTIPGHKEGGMRGELVVQGGAAEKKPIPATLAPLAALALVGVALLARRARHD